MRLLLGSLFRVQGSAEAKNLPFRGILYKKAILRNPKKKVFEGLRFTV